MSVQRLSIVQPMSDIAGIAVEIEDGGSLSDGCLRLFYEIADNPTPVFGCETDVLVGKTEGIGCLNKHSSTLGLFRVEQERVLVVVEPANNRDDEEDEYDDASVHPVDED